MIGYTVADSTYVNDSLTNAGGNVRSGEDGLMYAGLRNGMRTISNASSLTPTIDFEDFGIASVNYNMFGSGSSPQLLKTGPISVVQKGIYTRTLNQKYYELADHLGNIRAVVKDYKEKKSGNLWPSAVSYADYYAFGMMLPSRNANPGDYRFGFNGQVKDDEIKGQGNSIEFKDRIYDNRLGRFLSVDPLAKSLPWNSTYAFAENRPIDGIDFEGREYVSYKIRIVDGSMTSKILTEDYRDISSEVLKQVHNIKSDMNFYEIYSKGFGPLGRGILYNYEFTDNKTGNTTTKSMFFDKDKGTGFHGIYYGPGCPTYEGPIKEQNFTINPYDYTLAPVDEVDYIAKEHDVEYDFPDYGNKASFFLPAWLTDERTLEADIRLLEKVNNYLQNIKDPSYKDKITGRKPSGEAILKAGEMKKYFESLIIPTKKENLKKQKADTPTFNSSDPK